MEKNIKIILAKAKIKNIIYYRSIDDRNTAQYIHIVRQLREDLLDFVIEPSPLKDIDFLRRILTLLPRKIKSTDCDDIINSMKKLYEDYVN